LVIAHHHVAYALLAGPLHSSTVSLHDALPICLAAGHRRILDDVQRLALHHVHGRVVRVRGYTAAARRGDVGDVVAGVEHGLRHRVGGAVGPGFTHGAHRVAVWFSAGEGRPEVV